MKWIIILLAFIGSWEQMKAQQNPIILNEKNVTDLTTAADWDKLIDTWNYVPLENSDNSRLGSIETCYIYGDYLLLNSSYKCNGIHINNLFKFFVWCEVSKSFTRSII